MPYRKRYEIMSESGTGLADFPKHRAWVVVDTTDNFRVVTRIKPDDVYAISSKMSPQWLAQKKANQLNARLPQK